jgi:GMP synthase-like glutamine amidotransferase
MRSLLKNCAVSRNPKGWEVGWTEMVLTEDGSVFFDSIVTETAQTATTASTNAAETLLKTNSSPVSSCCIYINALRMQGIIVTLLI